MTAIRAATVDDIDDLLPLLAQLFAQEAEFTPDAGRQRAGLEGILADPAVGRVLVAEDEGRPAAMVVLLYTISTALGGRVAMLEDMIVDRQRRGLGLGRSLLDAALAQADADGCLRVTLLTDPENENAHHLYESAGFNRSRMVVFRRPVPREVAR